MSDLLAREVEARRRRDALTPADRMFRDAYWLVEVMNDPQADALEITEKQRNLGASMSEYAGQRDMREVIRAT